MYILGQALLKETEKERSTVRVENVFFVFLIEISIVDEIWNELRSFQHLYEEDMTTCRNVRKKTIFYVGN